MKNLAERLRQVISTLPRTVQAEELENLELIEPLATSVSELGTVIRSPESTPEARLAAVCLAGRLGDSKMLDALMDIFSSAKDRTVIWEAAKAIGRLDDHRSTEQLVRLLMSGRDTTRRVAAAWALGVSGDSAAAKPLCDALSDTSVPTEVRAHAAEGLGVLGATSFRHVLVDMLNDESVQVRYWAAYALGEVGDENAIPRLEQLAAHDDGKLTDSRSVKLEAMEAIDRIRERGTAT